MSARDRQRRAWLQQVAGADVSRLTPTSGDASFRHYFRVRVSDGQSRILMDAPAPREDIRPFVRISTLLATAGLSVPRIYAGDVDQGFLLLSDLGERLYLDALREDDADALYRDAIDALVRMQSCVEACTLPPYDRERLMAEMELFPDWFLGRHLSIDVTARLRAVLDGCFEFLVAACLELPRRFVHRDYHSRNLMVASDGNPGILDYQDAVNGPIAYDLVSLLRDVYVQWPAQRVRSWLHQYWNKARKAGLLEGVDLSTLTRWFDLTGVQRHLKVAGIFARLYHRDAKPRYLVDIPLTLRYLLEVAGSYRELEPLALELDRLDVMAAHEGAARALGLGPAYECRP